MIGALILNQQILQKPTKETFKIDKMTYGFFSTFKHISRKIEIIFFFEFLVDRDVFSFVVTYNNSHLSIEEERGVFP